MPTVKLLHCYQTTLLCKATFFACSNDLFYFMNLLSIFFSYSDFRIKIKINNQRILFNANKEINKRCFVPRDTTPQCVSVRNFIRSIKQESFESEKRSELLCSRIIYELPSDAFFNSIAFFFAFTSPMFSFRLIACLFIVCGVAIANNL